MSTLVARLWAQAAAWWESEPLLRGAARWMERGAFWGPLLLEGAVNTGLVLARWAEVRKTVGVLRAKKKDGVKFKVRSADELADRLRPELERHNLLVYPCATVGKGHVVDNGTLAEVTVTLRILCIDDGSYFDIQGFGLGADNQDKAGGKAATYAWKAALVQALTAGGEKDTDDSDTPIAGGVKPRRAGGPGPGVPLEEVLGAVAEAQAAGSMDKLREAAARAKGLSAADQATAAMAIRAAGAALRGA